ncbi:hypothetical protein BJV74DRAFT_891451 [Russula compacta]|nr:hypothetical protein BJV74DRAFT_891451 [Russula compacta]
MSNSPSDDAMRQGLSDVEPNLPSPTFVQPFAPSQLEPNSMSEKPSTSGRPASDSMPESRQETLSLEPSQLREITDALGGGHTSPSASPPVDSTVPLGSISEDTSRRAGSEVPPAILNALHATETSPFLIPLPESDVEDEGSSDFASARSMLNGGSQDRSAYTNQIDERTDAPSRSDVRGITQPTEAEDSQALWVLGDTVLERRDRRVHERWKAGLGANILSVIILCIALELYRRTKAAYPGLIDKIRARHIARVGRNRPFSPIVSLFFEVDAPFVHANTAFLTGLCTTLACTLLSDLALRWVARYDSRLPPPTATPRDRMIARMEWNERIERRAVPWLLEIGIPGLLYVAVCMFYTGAIMRAFPHLHMMICGTFGVLLTISSISALWLFEPALDARFRPKPVSSRGR